MDASLTGQRCLVTGASGFIGSHLTRLLVNEGARVRALVRRTSRLSALQDLPIELAYGDVTNPTDCKKAIEGIDYLFHVAGVVQVIKEDPELLFRINRDGVRVMLEAALAAKVRRCVLTSSVAAIGPSRSAGAVDETNVWDETLPHYPYARSKYEGERIALHLVQKGLDLVAVNPSTVIGAPDEGPSMGGKFLLAVLKKRFRVYVEVAFNCVDVEDVVRGHLLALTKGRTGERYILNGTALMLKEFLDLCERCAGIPSPDLKVPYGVLWTAGALAGLVGAMMRRTLPLNLEKVRLIRYYGFYSNEKARRELGWSPRPLEETLSNTLAWLREHHLK